MVHNYILLAMMVSKESINECIYLQYQIPMHLRCFWSISFQGKHSMLKKIVRRILYLHDGDIINNDVTIYLNVSLFLFQGVGYGVDFAFVRW